MTSTAYSLQPNPLQPKKIAYIVPGSGGTFYCQNCLRDAALIMELRKQGHDVFTAPMYLPIFSDESVQDADTPIFFGAVNMYLKYKFPFLQKAPAWLNKLLDSQLLLRFAAKKSESTSAVGLEDMTIAMLKGEDGPMSDDIDTLVEWLNEHEKPDIIHISNALLLGLAKSLKARLNCTIICSLQDEDLWVDAMRNPQRDQIWQIMSEQAQYVDSFIAVSKYYAETMQNKMSISDDKMNIVPVGIDLEGYHSSDPTPAVPTIGYLSKITESLGFSILIDAFIILKQSSELKNLQLHATGGLVGDDIKYVSKIRKRLSKLGFDKDLIIKSDFSREKRIEFLQNISVLSVPVPKGEAFGTYLLEAMASGIPVVQPNEGSFPELIEATYGGITYNPNRPSHLAEALKSLLLDPERANRIGSQGKVA
ncbi:MAG: glycosyltransferase family 4 protein, partial [Kiritimatiellae bacterium]|nr:glycosyltransferase family 4 protein [Kiritimatiellia bacterium]